jgi:OHCU decarboxylase
VTLDELNGLSAGAARRELERCCGSSRWAIAMTARRPFRSAADLARAADEVWWSLEGADWLEAFSHHPRIGERAAGWASDEQSGARSASDTTIKELATLNRQYERKFGHVFLIFASGRSAEEMLAELRRRLNNEPAPELRVAAGEQAKITRLRLEKLLDASFESSRAG